MISVILGFITAIWIIVGGVIAGVFYLERTLPAKSLYKNLVGVIACGPVVWIIALCVLSGMKLRAWLKD